MANSRRARAPGGHAASSAPPAALPPRPPPPPPVVHLTAAERVKSRQRGGSVAFSVAADDSRPTPDLDPPNDGDSETTMGDLCDDESVDLLSAVGDEGKGQPQSPLSPATQTLNRLSKMGSQEGGAELCIHLLNKDNEAEGANREFNQTVDHSSSSSNKRKHPNTTSQPAQAQQDTHTQQLKDCQTGDGTNLTPGFSRQVDAPAPAEVNSQISIKNAARFEIGTIVAVRDRQWPGQNKAGGVARLVAVHLDGDDEDEDVTYDVKYVLEPRRELGVEAKYVSLHTDYESPSKDRRIEETTTGKSSGSAKSGGGDDEESREGMSSASPPNFDSDGRPLSEYERQRLKNIQRNETRLKQLGLLVAPAQDVERKNGTKKKQKRKSWLFFLRLAWLLLPPV